MRCRVIVPRCQGVQDILGGALRCDELEGSCGKRGKTAPNAVDKEWQYCHTHSAVEVPFCWTGGYAL
jgi:hypothetical protein